MDKKLVEALREEFPGKNIVLMPEEQPEEVVAEISQDERESVAVALIDRSRPHRHRFITETYLVESGTLFLYVDGREHVLNPGETYRIVPGQIHWAAGAATRVRVTAAPPWTPADHLLVASS